MYSLIPAKAFKISLFGARVNYKKIIFLVSFLIVLGCLFNFNSLSAKAMTPDEMVALIKKFQQQIADLQKQLQQAQNTQTVWCHDFYQNLSAGSSNEEVAALHSVLEKEGFDIFDEEKVNKEFGESTASAISGFQQKYADEILKPLGFKYGTGILGKSTRAKLNKLFSCNIKATPRPFCSPISATCETSTAKIVCPAGLDDKGCPFPCKCVPVACAQETKTCPNGTLVSRIAPLCEFASCPEQTTNQTPVIYGIGGPTFLKVNEAGTWTVKASDPEGKGLIYSVLWGDESEIQSQESTTNAEIAIFIHSFNKAGAYNLTFTVADRQGLATKMGVTVKVEETISSLVVSEQVKCIFRGSQTEQKCNASSNDYSGYGCSGKEACVVNIKGKQGDKITWKSSCGGYAYTAIDGQNESAEFSCGVASASLNVISPNGQESWELGKAFEIKWKQTQSANVSVTVRNKQLPGAGGDLWFNMVVNGLVAGIAGENKTWWDVPNYLNAHTGYEICVAGSFTDGTGQALTLEDCSDSPFAIHGAAVSATPIPSSESGVGTGTHSFEILDNQASCSCPMGTDCSSFCKPASTYAIYFAKVSVYDEKGNFITSKDTSSGQAVFDNLPYGNYVAYISAAGYQEDKNSFSVGSNFPTNTSLMLKKNAVQTTTQTAAKSITVVSPNGGEKLIKGATYPIKWNSSGVASVYIKLRKGNDTYNGFEGEVSKTISSSGIFFWTIPATLPDGNDYAIRIVDGTAMILDDSNSLFSITASSVATPASGGGSGSSQTTSAPIPATSATTSIPSTQTVLKDTTSPIISAVSVSSITANSAVINWTTDEKADAKVEYSLNAIANANPFYGFGAAENIYLTSHSISIGNMQPNTLYYYRVSSTDIYGNSAVSIDYTLTTNQEQINAKSPTGYAIPLNQIANILEAAQAAITQISQGINDLLKNR